MSSDAVVVDAPLMPFREILAHARARRSAAFRLFIVILATSLIIAALLPPRYYATASLAVLPSPEFTVRQDAGSRAFSNNALAMDQVMRAEIEILQSADVGECALNAVGSLRVYPDITPRSFGTAVNIFRWTLRVVVSPWIAAAPDSAATQTERAVHQVDSDLLVLPMKDANVIEITFHNRVPAIAAQVVNAMLVCYARRREQLYDDPQLKVVRRQTQELGEAVGSADAALIAFKTRNGISDFDIERDLLVRRKSTVNQMLADAEVASAEQGARVITLGQQISAAPATVGLYHELNEDVRLQAIDVSLVDLRAQVAAARTHYRETSHNVSNLLAQLITKETDRQRLSVDRTPSIVRHGRNPISDSLLLDRASAITEHAAAVKRVDLLRRELQTIAGQLANLTAKEISLSDLMRRKTAANTAFASASEVLAEQRMTEAEDAFRLANVRVIESARTPLHAAPISLLVILAGGLLGTLAALLCCGARLLFRQTLMTPEGLAHATGLPVLGVFTSWEDQDAIHMLL